MDEEEKEIFLERRRSLNKKLKINKERYLNDEISDKEYEDYREYIKIRLNELSLLEEKFLKE